MLRADAYLPATPLDLYAFAAAVPPDHYLRQVAALLDFAPVRALLAPLYHPTHGRPALDPVLLFKLGFLQFHYDLSDQAVCERAQVDLAFRWFLDLSLRSPVPDPTTLVVFRQRLGAARYAELFAAVVRQARAAGLVQDRLRLKDATHVLANVAVPRTLGLLAQAREQLLAALQPFAPAAVAAAQAELPLLRTRTQGQPPAVRLLARLVFLRDLLAQAEAVSAGWGQQVAHAASPAQRTLLGVRALAARIVAEQSDPAVDDQVRTVVDPEARLGYHHKYFVGYTLDLLLDADSELITNLDLLAGNADEAADTTALVAGEEAAQGNDVAAVSLDRAGFRGALLREWQDPTGLGLEVFVPPQREEVTGYYAPGEFTEERTTGTLRCPAGQETRRRTRNKLRTGWIYTFRREQCAACPLRAQCLERLPKQGGRNVLKNDYAAEYAAARAKAETAEYGAVRREHWRVERKFAELMGRHRGRRMRYRGRERGRIQYLLSGIVVNVKQMVKLVHAGGQARARAGGP